ncbi:hypothetical protein HPB52_009257 [Rhipicephalus sanguineus]|uniref:BTB domain-containing protein n=1 Tax=Rhipicephalus sanguineus TaxID=34632 RepID=A0A9D4PXY0_RHISA|nr:hypothetical protein HPB52_009257 [Rhipicephalus sanguineus]
MSAAFTSDQPQREISSLSGDCVIRTVDGGEFRAHRGFLCALSPVFQALFSVEYGGRCDVMLQNVTASTMGALLGFYYSNKLGLNEDNVTEILATADMLLMDQVRNLCLHYMLRNMDTENCLGMAALAQWYHFPNFNRAVWRTSDEFRDVSEALLVELLSSNELNVRDEVDLLHAIVRWSSARNSSAAEAGAALSRLLQSVRVGLCESLALEHFCRLHPTLACSRAFSEVVWEPQQQGPCLCSPSPLLLVQYAAGRSCPDAPDAAPSFDGYGDGSNTDVAAAAAAKRRASFPQLECERCGAARNPERWLPRMPYEMLFVVGGWSEGRERDAVETYDPRAERAYHGVALVQNRLYVVGGMRETAYLRSCDSFDIKHFTWQSCSSMNVSRGYVSVVALEGYVYAVGGRNAAERTASVERYDPCFNQWTVVSAMNKRRRRIYVSGGFDGQRVLNSVEMYTPSRDTWCLVRQLPSPRCSHQMAVLGDRMYVIGGYDGRRRLSTDGVLLGYVCGVFLAPFLVMCGGDEGALFWRHASPMRIGRSTFAAALFDGELYVMGGFDGMGTTAEVERYSPSSDSWRPVVPLNEAVSAAAACAVKGLAVSRRLSACAKH